MNTSSRSIATSDHSLAPKIVVVDDEEDILTGMRMVLRSHGLGPVVTMADSRELLPLLDQAGSVVLLIDLRMPHLTGQELLLQIRQRHPHIPVIVVTALQDVDTAVTCMKNGATDYLLKPVNVTSLIATVRKALELLELRQHANDLKDYLLGRELKHPAAFAPIITRSPRMQALFKYLESAARTGEPLLIIGETGTGKELLAQAFHQLRASSGPLIPVNVAGLDDQMFADTLFGHIKGAFTGATLAREGLVAKAAQGTLFLDEIGDLSESSQLKLLRLIQEKKYEPLGADVSKNALVTIVAATNRDLKQRIQKGKFRADLFYRLATHAVTIPPLRERKEDILPLVMTFLQEATQTLGLAQTPSLPPQIIHLLECYDFPGNIRQLRALVMDAMANHKTGPLSMEMFRPLLSPETDRHQVAAPNPVTTPPLFWPEGRRAPTLKEAEEYLIAHAMKKSHGNQGIAASLLGLSRQALNQRLARRQGKESGQQ
ncbi:MAG: sigma-54-dependent Fis family transcriptional regulator [Magnetococcales bacterium]|nr:sigma-54-dependent Fis family transcriptional regulator [Magnetococcales bacterium]